MSTEYIVNISYKVNSGPLKEAANELGMHTDAAKRNASALTDATDKVNKYGLSQKQTAAAMRGVPAQITDITTSLVAGQNPMIVMIQQGGQLKDMFGGIKPAAAALGSQLLALVNPYTLAAAGAAGLGYVIWRQINEINEYNKSVDALASKMLSLENSGVFVTTAHDIDEVASTLAIFSDEVSKADIVEQFSKMDLSLTGLSASANEFADKLAEMHKESEAAADAFTEMRNNALKNTDAAARQLYLNGYITKSLREQIEVAKALGDNRLATMLVDEALLTVLDDQQAIQELSNHKLASRKELQERIKQLEDDIALTTKNLGRENENVTLAVVRRLEEARKELGILKELEQKLEKISQKGLFGKKEEAQAAERMAVLTEQNEQARLRYGTLRQQREIEINRAIEAHRLITIEAVSGEERAMADETLKITLAGINKQYDERENRANKADKEEERRLKRLMETRSRYEAELADARAKYSARGDATGEENALIRNKDTLSQATQRIELLRAEREAYESLGFTMGGYTKIGEGVVQASITMTQKKALELGIIKNINDEIDTGTTKYQEWAAAARAAAGEAVTTAGLVQQQQILSTVKQITEANAQARREQEMIAAILAGGIIPDSSDWDYAIISINEKLRTQQLILQGISEEQAKIIAADEARIAKSKELNDTTKNYIRDYLKEQQKTLDTMKNQISNSLGSAFDQAWDTGRIGFKQLLSDLLQEMVKSMFLKMAMNFMSGGSFSLTGQAKGGAWSNGVQFFANGGVVGSPTMFGMAGGKMGVMGEEGPEGILPLKRGKDGKLGVIAHGGGNSTVITIAPGAVVVNASGDKDADTAATAIAIDRLLTEKINKYMKDQMRPGNSLNPNFRNQRY